jgi:hypothetical protein
MAKFVWTKVGAEAGQSLDAIVARKEAERRAGYGVFWWGVGNSLSASLITALAADHPVPVVFSKALSPPKNDDSSPSEVWLWTSWVERDGSLRDIPEHVVVTSRGHGRPRHYAIVCESSTPFHLNGTAPFDPNECFTTGGKQPGDSQVTALLDGDFSCHSANRYRVAFQAELARPYFAELRNPRPLSAAERGLLHDWSGGNWSALATKLRSLEGHD